MIARVESLREQLRRNAVALISLVVAIVSLGHNTWRNERTEYNRNVRAAGFEILTKLAEFERLVFLAHYDKDALNGNPRTGWTYVIVINDMAQVMPGPVQSQASALRDTWRASWEGLGGESDLATDHVDAAITEVREATLQVLRSLH